jgi:endonuclease/exonuclease/phosphatase family metal-dependent hydrolase
MVAAMLVTGCTSGGSAKTAPETSAKQSSERATGEPRGSGPSEPLRVVTQNILHGNACQPQTDFCHIGGRVALFARQLQANGCPELVALQEANRRTDAELHKSLPGVCNGRYTIVWDNDPSEDRELVLTTDPVLSSERVRTAGPLRTAYWVRVKGAAGPVDLVTTHLASSSDDGVCDRDTCPPPCRLTDTLNTCQGREAAALLERKRLPQSVAILAGDLNAHPDELTIRALRAQGFTDTFVAAGNAECNKKTGVNCTSGRVDTSMVDLKNPNAKQYERIDYVFLARTPRCAVVAPTGVFAAKGGPVGPDGIVFPSDHSGVQATFECTTSSSDLAAAQPVATTTTTTRPGGTAVAPADAAAITAAYNTVFHGVATTPEQRARAIQDGSRVLDTLKNELKQQAKLLAGVSVRIDGMQQVDPHTVDVTYTILLNGNPVLDHLPGQAFEVGGRWLVARRSFCELAKLSNGSKIPKGCD